MSRIRRIRSAIKPFVGRALRGARGRRLALLSALFAALSAAGGLWLALGTGTFERELRQSLGLEQYRWDQETARHVVIADGEEEASAIRQAIAVRVTGGEFPAYDTATYRANQVFDSGFARVQRAVLSEAPRHHHALQARAQRAWETWREVYGPWDMPSPPGATYYNWYEPGEVAALEAVLARDLVPGVEVYASPLGPFDAVRLAGAIAGGMLMLLLLLAAPVLAGTQMAQETHENTLQPLAGSALRAGELAVGLTAGPVAIIAVLAAPQLVLLLAAAVVVGSPAAALVLVGTALAGGAFLVVLSQLAGLALGKVRSPGLVGGALAAGLGVLGGIGLALAAELSRHTAGALALLPQAAAGHALAQTFGLFDVAPGFGAEIDTTAPVLVGGLGMLVLAGLGLRALARRLGNTTPVTLRAGEALAAAVTAMVLVTCANPVREPWLAENFYLLNLGVLTVPLAILLMMRVPAGDVPWAMRKLPVGKLVGEFFAWAAIDLAAATWILGAQHMHVFARPIALAYLLWYLGVAALLALRVTAPLTFASRVWVGVCGIGLLVALAETGMWASVHADASQPIFKFSELSPLLGVVQAALTIVIPWTLLRALRRTGAPAAG